MMTPILYFITMIYCITVEMLSSYPLVHDDPNSLFYHNDLLYNCRCYPRVYDDPNSLFYPYHGYCITVELLSSCV